MSDMSHETNPGWLNLGILPSNRDCPWGMPMHQPQSTSIMPWGLDLFFCLAHMSPWRIFRLLGRLMRATYHALDGFGTGIVIPDGRMVDLEWKNPYVFFSNLEEALSKCQTSTSESCWSRTLGIDRHINAGCFDLLWGKTLAEIQKNLFVGQLRSW